jgi:hypothetical protein
MGRRARRCGDSALTPRLGCLGGPFLLPGKARVFALRLKLTAQRVDDDDASQMVLAFRFVFVRWPYTNFVATTPAAADKRLRIRSPDFTY